MPTIALTKSALLLEIAQETDSFSPLTADLKDFESNGLYFGQEILERMPGVGPIGGFLEVAAGQTARPSIAAISRRRRRKSNTCPIPARWGARRNIAASPRGGRMFLNTD